MHLIITIQLTIAIIILIIMITIYRIMVILKSQQQIMKIEIALMVHRIITLIEGVHFAVHLEPDVFLVVIIIQIERMASTLMTRRRMNKIHSHQKLRNLMKVLNEIFHFLRNL
jgi:hypothetical protein